MIILPKYNSEITEFKLNDQLRNSNINHNGKANGGITMTPIDASSMEPSTAATSAQLLVESSNSSFKVANQVKACSSLPLDTSVTNDATSSTYVKRFAEFNGTRVPAMPSENIIYEDLTHIEASVGLGTSPNSG